MPIERKRRQKRGADKRGGTTKFGSQERPEAMGQQKRGTGKARDGPAKAMDLLERLVWVCSSKTMVLSQKLNQHVCDQILWARTIIVAEKTHPVEIEANAWAFWSSLEEATGSVGCPGVSSAVT